MILFDRKRALDQIMGPSEHKSQGGEVDGKDEIHHLAQEAIDAIHSKDAHAFAEATHAMFLHFESMPHEENEEHEYKGE